MSDGMPHREGLRGLTLLPRDLTPDEIANAPVLGSLDDLLIDDLTAEEYQAYLDALDA